MDSMAEEKDKASLLHELRIDALQRDRRSWARGARMAELVALGLCLIVGALAAYGLLHGRRIEVEAATAAAPASSAGPTAILQATGYVTARRQATVSAQITGALKEVLIEEGERVTAGQVLARVDDTAQRAALAQSVGAGGGRKGGSGAGAGATRAGAPRSEAQPGSHRPASRLPAGAGDRATRRSDPGSAGCPQAEQVELAVAARRGAQVQLDYTIVRAPFSGVMTAKSAQAGEIVSPISAGGGFTRTGVGTIVDMDSLEIEVDVNEAYINRVQPQTAGRGRARRLSRLDDTGTRDRHHPDSGPQQGHREGPDRDRPERSPHSSRYGRARVVPRGGGEEH